MDKDDVVLAVLSVVLIVIVLCCVCFFIGHYMSNNKLQTLCNKKQYDFCIEQKQWEIKVD